MVHQPHSTRPDQARCFEMMRTYAVVTNGRTDEFDETVPAIIAGTIGNDI